MLFVVTAAILCVATAFVLRGSLITGAPITFSGFNGIGVILGFIAFVLASAVLGPVIGASFLLAVMLHELGHVFAHRLLGHSQTRFRLVPLMSKLPTSDQPLKNDGEVFFVALMGPGLSLAPMVLAFALSAALATTAPDLAAVLRIFAVTCGALNFINLLPFWPLDGGRCAEIATRSFWPALAPGMAAFMSAAFFVSGLRTGSLALMIFAAVGAATLIRKHRPLGKAMNTNDGLIALAAYTFTLAAHFSCGWWLLSAYF